jgi:hypothetical protein
MPSIVRLMLLVLVGFVLMLAAHLAAFAAYAALAAFTGPDPSLPYWWAYPIFYPLATLVAVRRGTTSGLLVACALCSAPALYFLALGIFESNWSASSTAIAGVGLAFVLAATMGTWAQRRLRRGADASV